MNLQVDPDSGQLVAWLNNYPDPWVLPGRDGGIIADGAGPGDSVFFADSKFGLYSSLQSLPE